MNTERQYDLAIIGGGITGAAIARDAAMRGLRVILLEQHDFGYGASSKTSKLAHGGLRYLENFKFGLVKASMHERALLIKNAPHLVKPLPFIFPVFRGAPHPFWEVKLGMWIYDFLKEDKDTPKHKNLTSHQILQQFPKIKHHKLKGGFLYYDAEMEDSRIVIENVLSARQYGAIALNYTTITGLIKNKDRITGASIRNQQLNIEAQIKAQVVVNASGAWSNQILDNDSSQPGIKVAPTKGAHLILPLINKDHALIMTTPQDERVFFLIPWNGYSLLGTTDTFYDGDPNNVNADEKDVSYLLKALHHYFPHLELKRGSIIASYAGLRPLISEKSETAYRVSRDHFIEKSQSGLITVLGGKYTTHRKIAEDVVDTVIQCLDSQRKFKLCATQNTPLYGGNLLKDVSPNAIKEEASDHGISEEKILHLIKRYGSAYKNILTIIKKDPSEGRQICELHPHLFAEVTYAITVEMAKKLEDWYFRRTAIGYTQCKGLRCLQATAQKFAEICNWDQQTVISEMESIERIASTFDHCLDKVKHL